MSSHVVSMMLHPESWQRDKLETRFEMAKRAFNSVRDEWLKRRRKYLQSREFHEAQKLEDEDKRKNAFREAMDMYGFTGPDNNEQVHFYDEKGDENAQARLSFFGPDITHHLNAEMIKRIGGMAARAVMHYHYYQDWGKPGVKHDPPPLVACNTGIQLFEDEGYVKVGGPRGGADSLKLPFDESCLSITKIERSLSDRKTYCKAMICREIIGGRPGYKVKITCNGHAPLSEDTVVKDDVVGVDVGVSTVAAVNDESAWISPICSKSFIEDHYDSLRHLQRHLQRQRESNPNWSGNRIEGLLSKSQIETYKQLDEAYRVILEERKRQHFERIKHLLSMGNKFIVEDNTYRGWQKGLFGSQVTDFSPATFINRLEEKAKAAGGWVRRISTWDTRLSSRCHCGKKKSKNLSERWHICECGVSAQRDLYSAFLARHIDEEGELRADHARKSWSKLEPALQSALSEHEVASVDLEKPPGEGLE